MDKVASWANYQAEKELGPVIYKTCNIAGTKAPTETNGQDVQMSQPQPLPINKHLNPSDLGVVLKISYRLFNSSPLRHKRFTLADQHSTQAIQDFIDKHRAKAELKETPQGMKWVITDKGLVDYMVISYISQDQLDKEQNRLQ